MLYHVISWYTFKLATVIITTTNYNVLSDNYCFTIIFLFKHSIFTSFNYIFVLYILYISFYSYYNSATLFASFTITMVMNIYFSLMYPVICYKCFIGFYLI